MYPVNDLEMTVLSCDNYFNFYLEIGIPIVNSISIK